MFYVVYNDCTESLHFANKKSLIDDCLSAKYVNDLDEISREEIIKHPEDSYMFIFDETYVTVDELSEKNLSINFDIDNGFNEDEVLSYLLITNNKTGEQYRIFKDGIVPNYKIPEQVSLLYQWMKKCYDYFNHLDNKPDDNIIYMESL